jgi:hypothetical protein
LNCSTETLTAVLGHRKRQLCYREHILNEIEGAKAFKKPRPHVLEPVPLWFGLPPGKLEMLFPIRAHRSEGDPAQRAASKSSKTVVKDDQKSASRLFGRTENSLTCFSCFKSFRRVGAPK